MPFKVTVAVEPAGTLPFNAGVLSLVRLSPRAPLSLGAVGLSWPVVAAGVVGVGVV